MSRLQRIGTSSRGRHVGLAAAVILVAVLVLALPATALARAEAEPNDSIGQADYVSDGFITGSAGPTSGGDADYSYFWGRAGYTYTIETVGSSMPDPTLSLHDSGGATLAYDDDSGPGLEALISYTAPSDGYLYVRVGAWSGSEAGGYRVNISPMTPPNTAPVANNDSASLNEDSSTSLNVLGNDSDSDGNSLSASLVSGPAHGSYSFAANGSVSYTPHANWNGTDSLTYRAYDGTAYSGTATVYFYVASVLDPPVGVNDSGVIAEDNTLNSSVLGNDYDYDGGTITATLNTGPSHGSLVFYSNGTYSYTPAANYFGDDSFTYRPYESGQYGNVTTVSLTVTPVNDVPTGNMDAVTVTEDEFVSVPAATGVLSNDPPDIEGSVVTTHLWSPPTHGVVALQPNGSFVYTPDEDYFGADSFTYHAYDGMACSAPITVNITVVGTPDAPVTAEEDYSVDEDGVLSVATAGPRGRGVLANDIDVDLEPLAAILVTDVEHGELTLSPDGSFVYVPDENWFGTDSFEYNPYDGALHGITVAVDITVNSVNDLPVATADTFDVDEDGLLEVSAPGLLANDSDPVEGSDVLVWQITSGPSHGVLGAYINGAFGYTPAADYNGPDSFTYRITDGTGFSDAVTVDLTVNSVNDAPKAKADSYGTPEDTVLAVDTEGGVLANDSDVDGDDLSATLVDDVANGTLTFNADGSYDYRPNKNWFGEDGFSYRVNDGAADSEVVAVSITVGSVNDLPEATEDTYGTDEDQPLNIAAPGVLGNDSDPVEGSELTAVLVDDVDHGTLSLSSDGGFDYTPDANWFGDDSFSYRADDGSDGSGVVTVSLSVASVNDAPQAAADAYSVDEDTELVVSGEGGLLDNDSDPVEGDAITAVLVDDVEDGTLSLAADGTFTYMPDANFNGMDSFTYKANDGTDDSGPVTVTITVNSVYDPPVAIEDMYECTEDQQLVLAAPGLLGNDQGDGPLSINAWHDSAEGTWGTVTAWADGRLRYTPEPNFCGVDSFVYRIGDGVNRSQYVTVYINVLPANDAPSGLPDSAFVNEDEALTVSEGGVLENDSDIDGDDLSAVLLTGPENGELTLNADGTYSYTPDADWWGVDGFTYVANDGQADSAPITVAITVAPVVDVPRAGDDSVSTDEDVTLTVEAPGVMSNDMSVEGGVLWASVVSGPGGGDLAFNADGSFAYTPYENWHGEDSFTYLVNDGFGASAPATVKITVNAVNDAPVAQPDTFVTDEDTELAVDSGPRTARTAFGLGVLDNDYDVDGDALSARLMSDVSHGSLDLYKDGSFTYVPDKDWYGEDSFTYAASDGDLGSEVVTVNITVNPVNDAPVATGESFQTDEDNDLIVTGEGRLMDNDSDIDGDKLSVVLVDGVQNGSITVNADGSFEYSPNMNWYGSDSFSYQVTDGDLYSDVVTTDITVKPVNDAPVAVGDVAQTDEDTELVVDSGFRAAGMAGGWGVLENDYDVDRDLLSAIVVDDVDNGTLALDSDGAYRYMPDPNWYGTDSFTYQASDGTLDSEVVTVEIAVNPINDAPIAAGDEYGVDEDSVLTVAGEGSLLDNDADVEEDGLSAMLVEDVQYGSLALEKGGSFEYTPDKDFSGTDSFTYVASDGDLDSEPVKVIINVAAVNDAPVAKDDLVSTAEDVAIEAAVPGVMDNDADVDGDSLTVTLVDGVARGELTLNADGSYTYTPAANWSGEDGFTYRLSDGTLDSELASVVITVNPVNDAPTATADSATVNEDETLIVEAPGVLSNDEDAENDALTAVLVDDVAHGKLTLGADGAYTYVPDADWFGEDSFTYSASDGTDESTKATVTITVASQAAPTTIVITSDHKVLSAYGDAYDMTGRLLSDGRALAGKTVVLLTAATSDGKYADASVTAVTAADGSFTLKHVPQQMTWYRVAFAGEADLDSAESTRRSALPPALLGNPVAPASMTVGARRTVYGDVTPGHTSITQPVRIYMYRYESGAWKAYGYVTTTHRSYSAGFSRYFGVVEFPKTGRWRVRAYMPYDAGHASCWSAGFGYVTVQ